MRDSIIGLSKRSFPFRFSIMIGSGLFLLLSLQGFLRFTKPLYNILLLPLRNAGNGFLYTAVLQTINYLQILIVINILAGLNEGSTLILRKSFCAAACFVHLAFPVLPILWFKNPPSPAQYIFGYQLTTVWIPISLGLCLFGIIYFDKMSTLENYLYIDIILAFVGLLVALLYFPVLSSLYERGFLLQSNTHFTRIPQISGFALSSAAVARLCNMRSNMKTRKIQSNKIVE